MIPEFGLCALIMAFCLALLSAIMLPVSVFQQKNAQLSYQAKPLVLGQCFFILLSFLTLIFCFLQDDFSVYYVAQNSYSHLPFIYKLCATWGAHEGSLLLWSLILSFWTVALAVQSRTIPHKLVTLTLGILSGLQSAFLLLILQTSNPFHRLLPFPAQEGADLNPLLQDPGFILHPPFLYLGYVGFALPFAFAMATLILKEETSSWTKWAKPWALLAWGFLSIGIVLGSWWAYYELGWGGWWFWDPVENASFMPWLVGTALIHALLISPQQKIFSAWQLLLALSAFILSLIGTFLVRSGVLSSVHAFASDPLRGIYILTFLAIVILGASGFYLFRQKEEFASTSIALLSKQSLLLLGSIIFFVAMLTVLLGTLYPLLIEVLVQEKISVGPPYFNSVFIPILLPALILMAITPHVHWQQETWQQLRSKLKKILIAFAGVAIITIACSWGLPILTLGGILVGVWVVVGTLYKLIQHWLQKRSWRLSLKTWSMVLAHLGVSFVVLGVTLTTALEVEKEFKIFVGQTVILNDYQLTFQKMTDITGPNFQGKEGHFIIAKNHQTVAELNPQKRFFIPRELPMTETAISPGLLKDFYLALGESFADGSWSVRFYIKPFVRWIWIGGLWIAMGAFLAAFAAFKQNLTLSKRE